MPYSAYCLFFVPPNKRLDPVLCTIGKWLIENESLCTSDLTNRELIFVLQAISDEIVMTLGQAFEVLIVCFLQLCYAKVVKTV